MSDCTTVTSVLDDIETELGGEKSFRLLYNCIDDVDVEKFHLDCDSKGPTVTILYGKNNIFGGYTSQSWSSDKSMKKDKNAFLFYKINGGQNNCRFIPIKEGVEHRAIKCHAKYGPTFGGGPFVWNCYDLKTFTKTETTLKKGKDGDGWLELNGRMEIGYAYCIKDKDSHTTARNDTYSQPLLVSGVEVYKVTDDKLLQPWREMPSDNEIVEMKRAFENLRPIPGVEQYNILLVGMTGSGKSSFYNTLTTVFAESVQAPASALEWTTSVTNEVHFYDLKSKSKKSMNIRIIDIRGFDDKRGYDHELQYLLEGRLQYGYSFPEQSVPVKESELVDASLQNAVHLVCFVIGYTSLASLTDALKKRIKEIQTTIVRKGLPMVIVATKFDQLCPKIAINADLVYKRPKAHDAVTAISKYFGIRECHVFPVVNYVNETKVTAGKDRLALQALDTMVNLVKGFIEKCKDKESLEKKMEIELIASKSKKDKEELPMKLKKELAGFGKQLRVLCVGAVGSGKTSFIDSMASALTANITTKASGGFVTDGQSHGVSSESTTERFQLYQMKFKQEIGDICSSNVFFGDLPGLQQNGGIQWEDIKYVIQGHVPNRYEIIGGIDSSSEQFDKNPKLKDRIHCVCFVFDISTSPDELPKQSQEIFGLLQRWIFQNSIPFVVILTKGDEKDTHDTLLENERIRQHRDKLIKKFRDSKMFPVINYVHENKVDPEKDALLLAVMKEILRLGKDYLEEFEGDDTGKSDDKNQGTCASQDSSSDFIPDRS